MSTIRRSIHQRFLPTQGRSQAFVWKYSPVNWGRRPRHFHIEPEFNLIASGRATFGLGDALPPQPGDVMQPVRLRLAPDDFRALVTRASAIVDRDGVDQPCAELWEQA